MADSPVDAAGKLVPLIRSCADQIDAARELPRSLFEALADAGMFHLAFPRSLGGAELDLPTYVEVIEEIGKADASTGWIVNQNSIFATYAARMPRDVARAVWVGTPRAVVANTPALRWWNPARYTGFREHYSSRRVMPRSRSGWPAPAWPRSPSWPAPRHRARCRRCCAINRSCRAPSATRRRIYGRRARSCSRR